jgi:hypothetical protein
MGNIVPGLAHGRSPRDSVIGTASPLFCDLVTGRISTAGRRTARR